ncbi:MAG: phenylacetate-CoA oxygenase subunit PaaC [Hyphomicrobiaceae bacterium]|nr:phenylacetate-CoA oxygenase subunit PaaC [Hyphomicrobiaceae bacterium]
MAAAHYRYLLRLADNALVLGHRLTQWSSRAPTLEEDIALSNMALDLVGQARALYTRACALAGDGRDEDQLAFLRDAHEFLNVQLIERPNGDFADTMARQLCYCAFAVPLWEALTRSRDAELAGIAAKAEKECAYHLRHGSEWVIRLGDGTAESHRRMQRAIDDIWMFTGELFEVDDVERAMIAAGIGTDASKLWPDWSDTVGEVLAKATLRRPADGWMISGGRRGIHTEHLGHMLAQMQFLQRAYPGATW